MKTIQISLVDANPQGLKVAEIAGKYAKVLVVPKEKFAQAQGRPDTRYPALYMLFSSDRQSVYMGSTENFAMLAPTEVMDKGFWQTLVICTATGGRLDTTDVQFLLGEAYKKLKEGSTTKLLNDTRPAEVSLHAFKKDAVLMLFHDFVLILQTLGFLVGS